MFKVSLRREKLWLVLGEIEAAAVGTRRSSTGSMTEGEFRPYLRLEDTN